MAVERKRGLVSIVVSNYNNEKYIAECLDSLVNQTYKNIEIVVVDDASTDRSINVINGWKEVVSVKFDVENRFTLLTLPKNSGFSGAVTAGLYLAKGEYIAMQDGDDISDLNRIEEQLKFLSENTNIKAVGTKYANFIDNITDTTGYAGFLEYEVERIREVYAQGGNAVSYGTLLFEGDLFDKVGGLTRRIDGAEDYEYITKLLRYGVSNIEKVLYYYRNHENQRSAEFYGKAIKKKHKVDRDKLNVLLVLDRFNVGGTETHVLSLARELINQGIKVTILGQDGPLGPEFRKLNCKIYNMEFPLIVPRDKWTIESFNQKIRRVIEAENISIIHGHQSPSGSLALNAGKEYNIPFIFTIHGMYYHDIASDRLHECNSIISVSHPVYEWLLGFNHQSKVVPNGVSYEDFSLINTENKIREELGIGEDEIVIMYCSRMAWGKIKVCENLIRVCRDLNRFENIKTHAIIVGDGPGYNDLVRAGEKANKMLGKEIIHFTGSKLNLVDYYATSDCVIGTGRVAIEAMAANKLVIASGNDGYFGPINDGNFYESWKMYFGDHGSSRVNNAMYLYEDLKNFYINKEKMEQEAKSLHENTKVIFDISVVAKQTIDVYEASFE